MAHTSPKKILVMRHSIGEGEIGVSPLQMANFAAIIANKGYYYTPHLMKKIAWKGGQSHAK